MEALRVMVKMRVIDMMGRADPTSSLSSILPKLGPYPADMGLRHDSQPLECSRGGGGRGWRRPASPFSGTIDAALLHLALPHLVLPPDLQDGKQLQEATSPRPSFSSMRLGREGSVTLCTELA